MGRLAVVALLAALVLVGAGCENGRTSPEVEQLSVPAAPESGQPRLQVAGDSAVWLSWVAPTDSGHALRYSAFADDAWSSPRTVATGSDWFVNWADLPSVVPLPDGRAAAHYLQNNHLKSNGRMLLAYDVHITQRSAAGEWQRAIVPHNDGTQTEHGFVSLLPWANDRLLAVWLDGRKMRSGTGDGEMTLRSAVIGPDGSVERRDEIDGRTCECCATSAVRVEGDALVAYRDRSEGEVRDIRLARFDGEGWSPPTRLHDDDWWIEGCPVNGPALAANGERVAVAWFTAAGGTPRVRAAMSTDGGRQFSDPIEVAGDRPKGRVDVAFLGGGAAAVSWLDATEDGGALRVRVIRPEAPAGPPMTLARVSTASREVGFPKMVQHDEALYLAWVEPASGDGGTAVRGARVPVDRIR